MNRNQSYVGLLIYFRELEGAHSHIAKLLCRDELAQVVGIDAHIEPKTFAQHLGQRAHTCYEPLLYINLDVTGVLLTSAASRLLRGFRRCRHN